MSDHRHFPRSRRAYVVGSRPDLRVPVRDVADTGVRVYDTSGAHGDPAQAIDLFAGCRSCATRGSASAATSSRTRAARRSPRTMGGAARRRRSSRRAHEPLRARAGRSVTQLHYARRAS